MHSHEYKFPFWASVSLLLIVPACSNSDGGTAAVVDPTPDATMPAQQIDLSLIGVHDPSSEDYDSDCIGCHGDLLNEYASDGVTLMAHSTMVMLHGTGNDHCTGCHAYGTDFVSYSAGQIRGQIDVERAACVACHGLTIPDLPEFYMR